jgi:hypothetical protein
MIYPFQGENGKNGQIENVQKSRVKILKKC